MASLPFVQRLGRGFLGRNLRIVRDSATRKNSEERGKEVKKTAKDPVCGMEVDEEKAPAKSQHMGKTYYFCAPACKRAFDEDPAKRTETGGHEMAGHTSHKL